MKTIKKTIDVIKMRKIKIALILAILMVLLVGAVSAADVSDDTQSSDTAENIHLGIRKCDNLFFCCLIILYAISRKNRNSEFVIYKSRLIINLYGLASVFKCCIQRILEHLVTQTALKLNDNHTPSD